MAIRSRRSRRALPTAYPQTACRLGLRSSTKTQIRRLAIFISEARANFSYTDFKIGEPPPVPTGKVGSEEHAFRIETFATGIDRLPYSIAPLPDGRILLTEKAHGLRIVSKSGELSEPIRGTPQAYDDGFRAGAQARLRHGLSARCRARAGLREERLDLSLVHGSLQRLQRGEPPVEAPRVHERAGSRPHQGRCVGGPADDLEDRRRELHGHAGHGRGRAHRVRRQGSRFLERRHQRRLGVRGRAGSESAVRQDPAAERRRLGAEGQPARRRRGRLPAIWTYGHRSPEGLEFDRRTGKLWETEMGQRGGDEVNSCRPARTTAGRSSRRA